MSEYLHKLGEVGAHISHGIKDFRRNVEIAKYRRELDVIVKAYGFNGLFNVYAHMQADNPHLYNHCMEVAKYAAELGRVAGFNMQYVHQLAISGSIHDAGKELEPQAKTGLQAWANGAVPQKQDWHALDAHPALSIQWAMMNEPRIEPQFLRPVIAHHIWHTQPSSEIFNRHRLPFEHFDSTLVQPFDYTLGQVLAVADVASSARSVKPWVDPKTIKPYKQALWEAATEKYEGAGHALNPHYVDLFIDKVVPLLEL